MAYTHLTFRQVTATDLILTPVNWNDAVLKISRPRLQYMVNTWLSSERCKMASYNCLHAVKAITIWRANWHKLSLTLAVSTE